MKFSYNLLKKFVDVKLSPEELAEILSLKTAEVEEVDKVGGDSIVETKILYSRGDLLSHYGLARDIAAIENLQIRNPESRMEESKEAKTNDLLEVEIANPELCPRYCGRIIRNVKVNDSPEWLKTALKSLGLRPINNIVDATNYVMLELGQPLHAFDFAKLGNGDKKQIIVRNANRGEKIKVLDEAQTEYELDETMLLIADPEKPLAIAGIKGGTGSEISEDTRTIILEAANFNPTSIRRTSTKLGVRTDASIRFSYGLDPNLAEMAINRAAGLIQELASGEITKGIVDIYPKKLKPWKVTVRKNYINSLIGAEVPENQTKKILTDLEMMLTGSKDKFIVTVPTHRLDIQTPEDIIEEIARIYSYEKIKPVPPSMAIYRPAENRESEDWDIEQRVKARNLMKNVLMGLGFTECYNYSFLSEKTKEIFNIQNALEIANPLSQETKYLRTGLIPNLALAAEKNLRFYNTVRLFETGNVFAKKDDQAEEEEIIAGLIVGRGAFIELKGMVESFMEQLGINDFEFSGDMNGALNIKHWFHPNRVAEVQIGDRGIGLVGDLHPKAKSRLDIKPELELAQFSFAVKPLVKAMEEELEFEPIPKYPSVVRDISILTDKNVKISQILNIIQGIDDKIVRDVDVFDIYETSETQDEYRGGEEADETEKGIGSGRKSIAFHVTYRADDRTLTDAEVGKIEQKIKNTLEEGLGAEIR